MEKTIENIKKIFHRGPKKKKVIGDGATDGKTQEVNEKVLTSRVELKKTAEVVGTNKTRSEVPIANDDDLDDEFNKCEGCNKSMVHGYEVTLSNGLCWHYQCFNCDNCGVDVSKQKYAYERGCLLCGPCIQVRVRSNCHKCVMTIEMDDTKLIVDGKEFHKACFACLICSLQLESVYGCKDDQYYCETCYLEMFGKKCGHCKKVILGEGLRFGESNYHRECFVCSECSSALKEGAVHSIQQRPACPTCYENQFHETCKVCQLVVAEGLKFRDQRFHQECFKCRNCGLLLADRKGEFLLTELGLQCKECVKTTMSEDIQANTVTENCTGCQLPIHVKNLVFDGESNWHYKCFCCNLCGSALVGQKYYIKDEKLFCNNCFLAEYLPTCYSCKVELHGKGGIKMNSSSGQVLTWHESCLQCSDCKDDLNMDNVVFNEKLFCKPCYMNAKLNKCDTCSKPISAIGFTFRGKFWHDTCFACDECGKTFLDGKFRNLRSHKLCDECFRNVTIGV